MRVETGGNIKQKVRPKVNINIINWIKDNLFRTWLNSILTIGLALLIFWVLKATLGWIFFSANWTVIQDNFKLLMVGQYPITELWRIWLSLSVVSLLTGLSFGLNKGIMKIIYTMFLTVFSICLFLPFITTPSKVWIVANLFLLIGGWILAWKVKSIKKLTWIGWFLAFPLAVFLLNGFGLLPTVKTNIWGGFLLTILIALVAIIVSFPIGVLLALGRTSKLPIIKWISIIYIEIIRGVPLITVLFMAQIMLPLFLPQGITIDNVIRVMVGFTLFNAAYIAENVRGGLQSIPRGQYEASHALGLNTWKLTLFIILPQALRVTIPSMVGQSISILKDVTLVAIVGLVDLLGIGRSIIANPQYLGTQMEMFLFVALLFWVVCYVMSLTSRRLEKMVNVDHR